MPVSRSRVAQSPGLGRSGGRSDCVVTCDRWEAGREGTWGRHGRAKLGRGWGHEWGRRRETGGGLRGRGLEG